MRLNYTKGPWVKGDLHVVNADGERVIICDGPSFGSKSIFHQAESNSKLVMASPEMYELLKRLKYICNEGNPMSLMTNLGEIAKETSDLINKIENLNE